MERPKYIEEFHSKEDIIEAYAVKGSELLGADILLAWYGYGEYCGRSFVIFKRKGKLYEVNGSHCSCFELEGQWEPEETSWEALAMRDLTAHRECGSEEANAALQRLVRKHLKGGKRRG